MADNGGKESKAGHTGPTVGLVDKLQEQWRKTKEHAETYQYAWGSYILVYSGLVVYLTWRWRKLRRTEDRVRVLQGWLRKLIEADEARKPPPSCFMTRIVGRGNTIHFWSYNWGQGIMKNKYQQLFTFPLQDEITLEEALQANNLASLFRPVLTEQAIDQLEMLKCEVQNVRQMQHAQQDDVHWKGAASGLFTVKSAYFTIKNGPRIASQLPALWEMKAPPRFKVFAWLLALNRILTIENLNKRGFNLVSICYMCRAEAETTKHLFNSCALTMKVYERVCNNVNLHPPEGLARVSDFIQLLVDKRKDEGMRALILISQFIIWRERCARIFKGFSKSEQELEQEIIQQWQSLR